MSHSLENCLFLFCFPVLCLTLLYPNRDYHLSLLQIRTTVTMGTRRESCVPCVRVILYGVIAIRQVNVRIVDDLTRSGNPELLSLSKVRVRIINKVVKKTSRLRTYMKYGAGKTSQGYWEFHAFIQYMVWAGSVTGCDCRTNLVFETVTSIGG